MNLYQFLSAVNESAQQGIALLSNWLGLAPNATVADDATATADSETENNNNISPAQQQYQQSQQLLQQQHHNQQQQQYIQPQTQHHINDANHYHPQSQQSTSNGHITFG